MLSVIVPVYNVESYLYKCLESLNNQTLNDIEFIIVNDGSTDSSSQICEEFIKGKLKFKMVSKKNGGLMAAWMDGVKIAKGDYIGFADSDDYVDNNMFEKMYTIAKDYKVDIVMCNRWTVYEGDYIKDKPFLREGLYSGDEMKDIYNQILPNFSGNHITNARWNKIYKSDLFLSNTKYCENRSRICEDRFIVPACMFSAKSFYFIQEPLYYYVQRPVSNHSMPSPKLYNTLKMLSNIQKQMLIDKKIFKEYRINWERANLNYIRININRNLYVKGNFKSKILIAYELLNDSDYRKYILLYKQDLCGKMGALLKISYRLNSPKLLVIGCSLMAQFKYIRNQIFRTINNQF